MPSILFVDDEPQVLQAMDNALLLHRGDWDMQFLTNPEEALAAVKKRAPDVIVTDMRMPTMDGAQLLSAVQSAEPHVVRVVLSAFAEFEATLRAVPIAHHYLLKPCEANEVWSVVQRAVQLRSTMRDPSLLNITQRITEIPPSPRAYVQLTRVLADPKKGIDDCLQVIERDVALTARVIRMASTAALGFHGRANSLQAAGVFLGTNMLRNVVLSVEAFGAFNGKFAAGILEKEQRHAVLTGAIAKTIAPNRHVGENACLAGILHDLGALLLACRLPGDDARARVVSRQSKVPTHVAEQRVLGTTHETLGAWALSTWGLPYPIVEAVAHHHNPRAVQQHARFEELGLVHVASALAAEIEGTGGDPLDVDYLESLGMQNELPEWRKAANSVAATIARC